MPSKKPRLHLALYARGGAENTYHWALIIGPKTEGENARGLRFHATERLAPGGTAQWSYEERDISLGTTNMLLIRLTIAKITRMGRALELLRSVPIREETPGWTCKSWVREALSLLDEDDRALGTRVMEWDRVHEKALSYYNAKKAENRFRGQGNFGPKHPPTFDLMQDKEVIP